MKWFKWLLRLIILGALIGVASLAAIYFYVAPSLPDVSRLKDVQLQTPMRVFSADGELISQFGEKRRIPLSIDAIPPLMKQAFLATEDSRFYQHPGIDPIGITRAIVNLVITGEKSQGASTITQQVARNFFLTREKTYIRKIREIFLALKIEQQMSKDEIFELYLNKIALGYRSYGVGAAAQVYYGKTVDELTLPQIAVIAGLPKAPSALNPIHSPSRAMERRSIVLRRMLDMGFIDEQAYQLANQAPITASYHGAEITLSAPYLAEMVRQELISRFGEDAYSMGLNVYTTLHSNRQQAADYALRQNLINYDQRHGFRGAIQSLWKDDSGYMSAEAIEQELHQLPNYGPLRAAVVMRVDERSIEVIIKGGEATTIDWDGLKWARRFIDDEHQGTPPSEASQIVHSGDIIWLSPDQDGYRLSQLPDAAAASVAIDPFDGAIEALAGGFSFNQSKFNHVTQAKRQVGSNIKPFIYSAALNTGMTLASIINDAPINHWDKSTGESWRPKNSPPVYSGPIRLRVALAQSKNVVSVRLLREIGVSNAIDYLTRFGFNSDELPRNETLSLGSASLTPMQVVTAFATFANGGFLVEPYFIERIESAEGAIVYQHLPQIACGNCQQLEQQQLPIEQLLDLTAEPGGQCLATFASHEQLAPQVIESENAFLISQAMQSAIFGGGSWKNNTGWNGTGWRAIKGVKRHDVHGKTGTTNDAKDAWFSGFTPNLVSTSWIGFDNYSRNLGHTSNNSNLGKGQVTGSEFGGKTAQPAWIDFMAAALKGLPDHDLTIPAGVTTARIDTNSGLLSNQTDYTTRFEFFQTGTEPTQYIQNQDSTETSQQQDDLF